MAETNTPDLSIIGGTTDSMTPSQPIGGASLMPQSPTDFSRAGVAPTSAPTSAPTGLPGRPWRGILQGALWGLMGAAQKAPGRGGFAAGLGMGAERSQQGQIEQKQMQFASVKAAQDYILAQKQAEEADLAIKEHQMNLALQSASYKAWMERNGVKPVGAVDADNPKDAHDKAVGLQGTIAQANDGILPGVQTTNSPLGVGADVSNHNIVAYTPTSPATFDSVTRTIDPHTSTVPNMINEVRKVKGLLPYNDMQYASMGVTPDMAGPTAGLKAKDATRIAQMNEVEEASRFMNIPPLAVAKGASAEDIQSANAPIISQLENDINSYKAHGGDQPETLRALTDRLNAFKSRVDNAQSKSIDDIKKRVLMGAGTEPEAAAVFDSIDMKMAKKQTLSEDESAFYTAYKNRKTLTQQAMLAAGQMSPDALDMASKEFLTTGILPQTGFGPAGTQMRTNIMNRAAEVAKSNPDLYNLAGSKASFVANQKTYASLTGTMATLQGFEAAAGKNIDQFLSLVDKLPDTGMPWLNKPARTLDEKAVGAEWMPAVRAAREVGLREVARVTNDPKLSGVLSDTAREEVKGLIPDDATVPQIKHAVQILRNDMKNVETSVGEQRDNIGDRMGIRTGSTAAGPVVSPAALQSVPSTTHVIGEIKKFSNGRVGKWDGKGWVDQPQGTK